MLHLKIVWVNLCFQLLKFEKINSFLRPDSLYSKKGTSCRNLRCLFNYSDEIKQLATVQRNV